jgi:hypothetical protein
MPDSTPNYGRLVEVPEKGTEKKKWKRRRITPEMEKNLGPRIMRMLAEMSLFEVRIEKRTYEGETVWGWSVSSSPGGSQSSGEKTREEARRRAMRILYNKFFNMHWSKEFERLKLELNDERDEKAVRLIEEKLGKIRSHW